MEVEMTVTRMPVENEEAVDPARVALLAFHEGLFDGGQLRRVVRCWVENPEADLRKVLLDEGLDAEKVSILHEQLLSMQPGHAPNAPHFSQLRQHSTSAEVMSTSSPDAAADPNAPDRLEQHAEQRGTLAGDGDIALPRSSKKKDRSGAKRLDYYDSVHEQFTRDDRLLSSLFRSIAGFRRKVWMDLRRFFRSAASLLDILKDWLRLNYRNAIIGAVVIALLIPASILISQFIRPSKQRSPSRLANGLTSTADSTDSESTATGLPGEELPTSTSGDGRDSATGGQEEPDGLDIDSLELGRSDRDAVNLAVDSGASDGQTPEGATPGSDNDSLNTDSEVSLASAEHTPVRQAAPPEPTREERMQQAIAQGVSLIKNKQFGRASVLLSRSAADFPDSRELMLLRCVALMENQKIGEAGELLVTDQFADAEDDVWQALFVSWLLSASPQQRSQIRGELSTICSTRSGSDPLARCIAWIDARDRKYRTAGRVLTVDPLFGSRSFADALFYCISLYGVGQSQLAREMLEYSRKQFEVARLGVVDSIGDSDAPEVIAIRWTESLIKSTLNSFAAKLR